MSHLGEEQSGSISTSPASKLQEIFETLSDINLEGRIEDQETKPLGLGSSADVFRARYPSRNKIVAVKRIRIFLLDNISFASNLGREVRLWSKLNHPNVLPLLGYFFEGSKPIPNLVSELMKNGTLIEYMRDRPFDALEMCKIIFGIASGLHYIHTEHNMIHADLKGSNILISDDGRPLLADFGLSVSSGSTSLAATTYHGQKGSLRWMAKELHSNSLDDILENPKHTTMSDIWAFGMVIYELLSRKIPYESVNDRRISAVIASGILPQEPDFRTFSNSVIFRGLWGIARDCWHDDPLQRPSALDVHEELLTFERDFENNQTGVKAVVDDSERTQDFVLEIERLQAELKESKLIIRALTHHHPNNDNSPQSFRTRPTLPTASTLLSPSMATSISGIAAQVLSPLVEMPSFARNGVFFKGSSTLAPQTQLPFSSEPSHPEPVRQTSSVAPTNAATTSPSGLSRSNSEVAGALKNPVKRSVYRDPKDYPNNPSVVSARSNVSVGTSFRQPYVIPTLPAVTGFIGAMTNKHDRHSPRGPAAQDEEGARRHTQKHE